jgi:multidrug efflux pump subunit AcrA (membrane-fusion protein)
MSKEPDGDANIQPPLNADELEAGTIEFPPRTGALHAQRRLWFIITIVILVVFLVSGAFLYWLMSRPPAVIYTQAQVRTGNISGKISVTGHISPNAQYSMNFSTAGQVSEINVAVSQQVKQGQTLAKLTVNTTALQDSVNAAQLAVNSAQNTLNQATTQSQRVTDQDALDRAKQQLQAAQHNLDAANASAVMVAPSDATVAAINGVVGQSIGSSSTSSSGSGSSGSASSAFMVLTDLEKLNIVAAVNEVDIANVQVGQPAHFTVAAYPNSVFHATVSAIDTIGQATSNIVNYAAHLTVDMASVQGAHVYAGMTATISITTQQRIGVLLIPTAALTYPGTAVQNGEISRSALATQGTGNAGSASSGSQRTVLQLKDGKLTPVTITIGLNGGSFVEVLSGLQEGDQVVVGQTGGNTASMTTGGRLG